MRWLSKSCMQTLNIKFLVATILVCFSLVACGDKTFDNLKFHDCRGEVIDRFQYVDDYGVAMAPRSGCFYVVYGGYPSQEHKIPSGVVVSFQGYKRYSILQLLKEHPNLASEKAIKAATVQQEVFKRRLPNYYDPSSTYGTHGGL